MPNRLILNYEYMSQIDWRNYIKGYNLECHRYNLKEKDDTILLHWLV